MNCACCDKPFEAKQSNRRFCSDRCRMWAWQHSAAPQKLPPLSVWSAYLRAEKASRRRLFQAVAPVRPCRRCAASRDGLRTPTGLCRDCEREKSRARMVPCAACGEPRFHSRTSLPPGEATCRPCRQKARDARLAERPARPKPQRDKKRRDRRTKGNTTDRGYGHAHRLVRMALLAAFVPGEPCPICDEPMLAGEPLDLDHSDPASRLRREPGDQLTHSRCNRSSAAAARHLRQQVSDAFLAAANLRPGMRVGAASPERCRGLIGG